MILELRWQRAVSKTSDPSSRWSNPAKHSCASTTTSAVFKNDSPEDGSSGVLLGFVFADSARFIDEKSEDEIQALTTKDFVNYLGPEAGNATSCVIQRWNQEEYSRGGYGTNFGTGTLSKYGKFLAKPEEGIHFAGVETALFWRGYMDGAISSGQRVAKEVVTALGYGH